MGILLKSSILFYGLRRLWNVSSSNLESSPSLSTPFNLCYPSDDHLFLISVLSTQRTLSRLLPYHLRFSREGEFLCFVVFFLHLVSQFSTIGRTLCGRWERERVGKTQTLLQVERRRKSTNTQTVTFVPLVIK